MNSREQVILNVVRAWIKRAPNDITIRPSKVSFDAFDESLKGYPNIVAVINVEIHTSSRVYQFDKIVEYLTKKCNGVIPCLPFFRENDTDYWGNYFVFDTIAFKILA